MGACNSIQVLPGVTQEVPLGVLINGFDEVTADRIRRKLVGVQMLACIQNNLMDDIQSILRDKGRLKYDIKRNMGQIKKLCMDSMGNKAFLGKLSQQALDVYFQDYERLEKYVYEFIESDD